MLFNSFEFILIFLPTTFFVFFFLNGFWGNKASRIWLLGASLFFYGWWNPFYVPLILGSIIFNYGINRILIFPQSKHTDFRRIFLALGILGNLALLGYFKYTDFLIENWNWAFHAKIEPLNFILPLAISFFTFQQIAYLVDSYKGAVKETNLFDYALFVLFFPQLIAGPIVHHLEMMPQLNEPINRRINPKNVVSGLLVFSIGLFKKVVIADTFAIWASRGFDATEIITLLQAWVTSLSFTLQLYFDFSGYTDMALGSALVFNIRLPENFNSPYKALNIRDFWRRWHMSLSRFLLDYIYIPLGGNRSGLLRTCINLITTFFLCGLWHGAGWTFIFWGLLNGIALIVHHFWLKTEFKMHYFFSGALTFLFVNFAWVFFRADEWKNAVQILTAMLGFNGVGAFELLPALYILFFLGIVFGAKNSMQWARQVNTKTEAIYIALFLAFFSLLQLNNFQISNNKTMEFLYFNF
ncbi:MAG: MBOAT family protein [Nitrospinaceae bacterium]|jgi:alginate O-acetyltransferase complex protein AlgI|nr:MBOAT family protein [Nitrospina sp.]MBT5869487.1 MBOAT family protein [Nitrospinaceae bacterium]MBT6345168.1 MBOAT family protein [Nitrospina sp.]